MSNVPANLSRSPPRRTGWNPRSVPMAMPISNDQSGVVAFSTPATPESTDCSPMAKRKNGRALQKKAATTRWPQVARSLGRRWRARQARPRRTAAPSAERVKVIWSGVSPLFRASLIHRKPDPHSSASTAMRTSEPRPPEIMPRLPVRLGVG